MHLKLQKKQRKTNRNKRGLIVEYVVLQVRIVLHEIAKM